MRFELDFPVIQNSYTSKAYEAGWFSKSFPSFVFYRKMLGIVFRSSRLAKRGKFDDPSWCLSSYDTLQSLESVGATASVEGLENVIQTDGPCIIIGNHMSTLETFVLPYLICPFKKVTFIVKEALVNYPVFKHVMMSRNPIVVGRENPKQDFMTVLKGGSKRIQSGYSIAVFPQTTRMTEFDRSQFNSIGIKLAKRADVPVIPLALKTDCWGNGMLIKDFGKIDPNNPIKLKFGERLRIEGNGKAQQEAVISHIENCLTDWKIRNY
ncbi:MAG: 1-acyl-sn-glycerol-3-phosphate acyltransferase [Opitutaceae bacterium]|nr:1-acyl-sn-glycerol-3-phosphate acyltransferase [Opitutaceae bacterium]